RLPYKQRVGGSNPSAPTKETHGQIHHPLESGRFSLLLAANVKTRPFQITIFYINSHAKSKAETVRHIL
ncbi:hypothetical protein, partial [Duncaniella muris]|uniref:hypothetical protein n=1 Tax=Duncaniella muris TaxID=2094150 RepID=UPI0026F3BECA